MVKNYLKNNQIRHINDVFKVYNFSRSISKLIRFIIVFFLIITNNLFAEIKKINVVGNSRVNSVAIESLVDKKIS
jgi:hypothetical protein